MKIKVFFFLLCFFTINVLGSQEKTYIHLDERLGWTFPFAYSFVNGNGYLELSSFHADFLTSPSNRYPMPEDPNLSYYIIKGSYKSCRYKDFTILHFDSREYLFLESDDENISLLLPLQEDNFSSLGKHYGGIWNSFWGMNKQWYEKRILITGAGPSIYGYSSALKETINGKTINYNHFSGPFFVTRGSQWVEGAAGYGIGEFITIGPGYSWLGIVLLNGFIAPWNLELYYSNSRVKRIKVEYNDNIEQICEINDSPNPQIIMFKEPPTSPIKITILDIYPGTLYQDTAISNILFIMQK